MKLTTLGERGALEPAISFRLAVELADRSSSSSTPPFFSLPLPSLKAASSQPNGMRRMFICCDPDGGATTLAVYSRLVFGQRHFKTEPGARPSPIITSVIQPYGI
jgi:hypothetical protein